MVSGLPKEQNMVNGKVPPVTEWPFLKMESGCAFPSCQSWYYVAMETIIRHVRDIDTAERHMLEHVIGQQLQENQKIIIQVVGLGNEAAAEPAGTEVSPSDQLPEWCNIYEGLSEKEIDEIDAIIRERANLTRPSA
jgi:hypothetical protein